MSNELAVGAPRIGWMIDGDPSTPERTVMLQDTGEQILLTVPFRAYDVSQRDPYERWFGEHVHWGDDPQQTKYRYSPPSSLMFGDSGGPVVLVGCRTLGMSTNMAVGDGRIIADFAVFGARHRDYDRVNGIRSEMPALSQWLGIRSVTTSTKVDDRNRLVSLTAEFKSPPAIRVSRRKNLTLQPSWTWNPSDASSVHTAHDELFVETSSKRPYEWYEHLEPHLALRDLVAIASWRPVGFRRLHVLRVTADDAREPWREVRTYRVPQHAGDMGYLRFLFDYGDVGTAGLRTWLDLRRSYARALVPLATLVAVDGGYINDRILQLGVILEALGCQLEVERGAARFDGRGQLSFNGALESVLADTPVHGLADVAGWRKWVRKSYIGVKHPDKPIPDMGTLVAVYRSTLLVLRCWVAGRLGVPDEVLARSVETDRFNIPFTWPA